MQIGRRHLTIGTVFPATVSALSNQARRLVGNQRSNRTLDCIPLLYSSVMMAMPQLNSTFIDFFGKKWGLNWPIVNVFPSFNRLPRFQDWDLVMAKLSSNVWIHNIISGNKYEKDISMSLKVMANSIFKKPKS